MELGQYILLYLVGSLCLVAFTKDDSGFAQAEKFFLNKDQITSSENRSKRSAGIIRSTSQANAYMMRYGYLKCKPHGRKKEGRMRNHYRQFNRPGLHHHHQQQQPQNSGLMMTLNCDKQRVSQAIIQYQRTYHLPVTGQLDKGTKELMSESRCGNRDQNDGVVDEEVLQAQHVLLRQMFPHQQSLHRKNRRFGRSVELNILAVNDQRNEETKKADNQKNEEIEPSDNAGSRSDLNSKASTLSPLYQSKPHSSSFLTTSKDNIQIGKENKYPRKPYISAADTSTEASLSIQTTTSRFFDSLPLRLSSRFQKVFLKLRRQKHKAKNGLNSVIKNEDSKLEPNLGTTVQKVQGSISPRSPVNNGGSIRLSDRKDDQNNTLIVTDVHLDKTNILNNQRRWRSKHDSITGLPSKNSNPYTTKTVTIINQPTASFPLYPKPTTQSTPFNKKGDHLLKVASNASGAYNDFNTNETPLSTGSKVTLKSLSRWWPTPPNKNHPILFNLSQPFTLHSSMDLRLLELGPTSSTQNRASLVGSKSKGSIYSDVPLMTGNYDQSDLKDKENGFRKTGRRRSRRSSISKRVPVNETLLKTTTTTTQQTKWSSGSEDTKNLTNKRILKKSLHSVENEAADTGERNDKRQGSTTTTMNNIWKTRRLKHRETNHRKKTRAHTGNQFRVNLVGVRSEKNKNRVNRRRHPCRARKENDYYLCIRKLKLKSRVNQAKALDKLSDNIQRCRHYGRHRRCRHKHGLSEDPPRTTTQNSISSRKADSLSFIKFPSQQSPLSTSLAFSSKKRSKRSPFFHGSATKTMTTIQSDRRRKLIQGRSSLFQPTDSKSFTIKTPSYHSVSISPLLSKPYLKSESAVTNQLTPSPDQHFVSFPAASYSPTASLPSPTPNSRRPSRNPAINRTLSTSISTASTTDVTQRPNGDIDPFSRQTNDWPETDIQGDLNKQVTHGLQTNRNRNNDVAECEQVKKCKNQNRNGRFNNNNNNNNSEEKSDLKKRRKELLQLPSPSSTSFLSSDGDGLTTPHYRWWNEPEKESLLLSLIRYGMSPNERYHFQVRTNFLHRTIDHLKKTDPLLLRGLPAQERTKRSLVVNNMTAHGQMFKKKVIRWRLLASGYSNRIPLEEQRATLTLAFRMWNEVIPINFVEDLTSDVRDVDIHIAFGRGAHQNCEIDFDGTGGDVAHSWYTGNMHFDDDENFKAIYSPVTSGIYLLRVAVHEIGHVLGLEHTEKVYSIMYAIYHSRRLRREEFELGWEDRKDVQKIYGVCRGTFNTVFDWVRRRPNEQFIFNTYFFRGNRYWMYENHANRTRYGDPLNIAREWQGVPNDIDGYAHIWFFDSVTGIIDITYFFKGANYYMYDSIEDRVVDGWPRKISDGFGPKEGSKDRIPDNLDTIFFDMRDSNIYFFKGDKVYVYNPRGTGAPSTNGCCERIANIRDEYPSLDDHPLPDNLDAVYYSYKEKSMYFLKGEDVWRNSRFHRRQHKIVNGIKYEGKWYDHWYDICDVKNTIITPSGQIEDIGT